ncbi:MAG: Hsp20/alpha crystallin family protein [Candidatus Chaera renei]|uniref:Hsp20/alpha crystallin family protein n=1 Tax=Candidatus Chaera renei TaxID=2506947 RepID=A0A4Q0AIS7_9BACT|nr:MAG: Hsp20/alpha crystallin family protein [Candidatus Chaera renei]
MAKHKTSNDDLLMEDELAAAFLGEDEPGEQPTESQQEQGWDEDQNVPGQLAVDVYETAEKLVVKARTAGVNRSDLDVSISDGVLTISGTLSSGDEGEVVQWHMQECYWGEFTRTLALPVPVKEDESEAVLKDGVLTISFIKVKQEQARKIEIR